MRKQIQEKLIKFATRIPVFMYLSDYREYCLRDVIQELEPELFKRYEDASLSYTGIDKHAGEQVGLYSTVLSRVDYDKFISDSEPKYLLS